jgi:hypothetical protein
VPREAQEKFRAVEDASARRTFVRFNYSPFGVFPQMRAFNVRGRIARRCSAEKVTDVTASKRLERAEREEKGGRRAGRKTLA